MQKDVESLDAPVDLGSGIFNSVRATTLFKEFVNAILENDMSDVEHKIEPLMLSKVVNKVNEAHKTLDKQGLVLRA